MNKNLWVSRHSDYYKQYGPTPQKGCIEKPRISYVEH